MGLKDYWKKRDFKKTTEPKGKKKEHGDKLMFVIQKHDARSLHYDFRVEVDGVLKSWAVPKGPSLDPSVKRLAVMTEDHPMEYGDFEGVIPEGQYGAGTVIVWDTGTYENITIKNGEVKDLEKAIEDGHFLVWLNGKKLKGGYALTRTRMGGKDENWLLVKMDDEESDARRNPVSTEPESVLSGRTNKDFEKK